MVILKILYFTNGASATEILEIKISTYMYTVVSSTKKIKKPRMKILESLPCVGGKKCLACKQRLAHDKWNVQPKLAEERWAHQEARKREIAEVADFLGV